MSSEVQRGRPAQALPDQQPNEYDVAVDRNPAGVYSSRSIVIDCRASSTFTVAISVIRIDTEGDEGGGWTLFGRLRSDSGRGGYQDEDDGDGWVPAVQFDIRPAPRLH